MDLGGIDFLVIELDFRNTQNVLIVTDHYAYFCQAFAVKDFKVSTVLWELYFVYY